MEAELWSRRTGPCCGPDTIGALPVPVAQGAGILVGYLPGLLMRRIADFCPDEAKTDARDT